MSAEIRLIEPSGDIVHMDKKGMRITKTNGECVRMDASGMLVTKANGDCLVISSHKTRITNSKGNVIEEVPNGKTSRTIHWGGTDYEVGRVQPRCVCLWDPCGCCCCVIIIVLLVKILHGQT